MKTKKTIDVLNTLIEVHNERMNVYETASKETHDTYLKSLLNGLHKTSERCKKELAEDVEKLGGKPTNATDLTGKLFMVWMDIKAAFTRNERKPILDSCVIGEDEALSVYKQVIEENAEHLSAEHQKMVNRHYDLLKEDHDHVKSSRDLIT